MDRRHFFKTVLTTPLLTPLLLASRTSASDIELFLVGDEPHLFIGQLLEGIQKYQALPETTFAFVNRHPREEAVKRSLVRKAWKPAAEPSRAALTISSSSLRGRARPSFTLVRNGQILDIRSSKLLPLWKEMTENHAVSAWLTVASLKKRQRSHLGGKYLSVYKNGQRVDRIPLAENITHTYAARRGPVTLRVKDGKAWIVESSCRNQVCCYSSPASLAGERIICAPNRLLLQIEGSPAVDTSIG